MGNAADRGLAWDWSTQPSCTGQTMSSLCTEMLLGLMDPFYFKIFLLLSQCI